MYNQQSLSVIQEFPIPLGKGRNSELQKTIIPFPKYVPKIYLPPYNKMNYGQHW